MVVFKDFIFKALNFLLLFNALNFNVFAQSKHATIWLVCSEYYLDFRDGYVQKKKLSIPYEHHEEICWYIDNSGEISVKYENGSLYGSNGKKIDDFLGDGNSVFYFIPVPENENLVFFVSAMFYKIDVLNNKIIETFENPFSSTAVFVGSGDCQKTWVFDVRDNIIYKYILTEDGIQKTDYTFSIQVENELHQTSKWYLNFSKNCNLYTLTSYNGREVFFGEFDRINGIFIQKSRYKFSESVTRVNNSIIAPDDSEIYYFIYQQDTDYPSVKTRKFIKIPIIDNMPNYDELTTIYSYTPKLSHTATCDMFYGLDSNIYVMNYAEKVIDVIEYTSNKIPIYKPNFINIDYIFGNTKLHFQSDWFSDNPCGSNSPCQTNEKRVKIICE